MTRLPEFKLLAEPADDAAKNSKQFQWAPAYVGTRHKLGGTPDFLQPVDFPKCVDCECVMTFYGQLDSVDDDVILGDCGLVYIFVCFDCLGATAFIQSM